MPDLSDDILIKASQGDVKSFEVLYRATAAFVYNVALRMLNNREDAEEITQEVFLIVYHKLKSFRFESSFKTWIYRITVNLAINFSKKKSRMKSQPMDENAEEEAVRAEAHEDMDKEEKDKMIGELLGAINVEQRACVVLRSLEGLSYEDIARTLNININTVRSRLKRAREKMLAFKKETNHERL